MNMKKLVLTTLCVLAAMVAAQNACAQGSPSVDARIFADAWGSTRTTKSNRQATPAPAAETNGQEASGSTAEQICNAGKEMKIVNSAEYAAECINGICKAIGNFFKGALDNMSKSQVMPGPEGKKVEMGVRFFERSQAKRKAKQQTTAAEQAKVDSITKAVEKAHFQAAKKAYLEHQSKK